MIRSPLNPQPTGAAGLPMSCPREAASSTCGPMGCGPTAGGAGGGCDNSSSLPSFKGGMWTINLCIAEVNIVEPTP